MKLSRAERKKTHSRSQFWFGKQLCLKPHGFLPGGATTSGEDTLSGFFFFFFSLSLPWKVFLLFMGVQFAIIDLRLSLERNLFLSMGLSLPEDNIFTKGYLLIPYQKTSSSGQNVFIPSSGAETLKLNITDVKRGQRVCWTFKRTLATNENSAYGDRLYFLSKRKFEGLK